MSLYSYSTKELAGQSKCAQYAINNLNFEVCPLAIILKCTNTKGYGNEF